MAGERIIQEHHLTGPEVTIDIPTGAQVLGAGAVAGAICLWAEADPASKLEKRTFLAYPSREQITDPNHQFIGTVIRGARAWHIYEAVLASPRRRQASAKQVA